MFSKIVKTSIFIVVSATILAAGSFNAQAEKDRLALQHYMLAKFKNPVANRAEYFPYMPLHILKTQYAKNLKLSDFLLGSYAYDLEARKQYTELNEFPPYVFNVSHGEKLYSTKFKNGKSFKNCFPNPAIKGNYPYFDTKKGEVVTIGLAINECRIKNGEKPWKYGKGKLADLDGYFAFKSRGQVLNVTIPNAAAEKAYNAGKKYYYSQRGSLKMSCATCHVQGAGNKLRAESLSPLLGQYNHFPVYRLKWQALGTLQRRFKGCNKNQGEQPQKLQSKDYRDLEYFLAYMSNGLKLDGPDIRK